MMCELVSEERPVNRQKVSQGKNCEDGLNWYAYVGNDPVSIIDPFGLQGSDQLASSDMGLGVSSGLSIFADADNVKNPAPEKVPAEIEATAQIERF